MSTLNYYIDAIVKYMTTSTIITLEVFEQKAKEARELLYSTYVEINKFKAENKAENKGVNNYIYQINQERLIYAKSDNCKNYLRYFAEGDFDGCERILLEGFYVKPILINEEFSKQ